MIVHRPDCEYRKFDPARHLEGCPSCSPRSFDDRCCHTVAVCPSCSLPMKVEDVRMCGIGDCRPGRHCEDCRATEKKGPMVFAWCSRCYRGWRKERVA